MRSVVHFLTRIVWSVAHFHHEVTFTDLFSHSDPQTFSQPVAQPVWEPPTLELLLHVEGYSPFPLRAIPSHLSYSRNVIVLWPYAVLQFLLPFSPGCMHLCMCTWGRCLFTLFNHSLHPVTQHLLLSKQITISLIYPPSQTEYGLERTFICSRKSVPIFLCYSP